MEPQLPQIVKDYIDAVIKKMGYRRKVRQDVRQELTDHFTDALRDATTEDEKLTAAKNLIKQFGEPKLLGKLMRRAKKRCRPLWVKFIIRSLQTFGALILLIVLYGAWFASGKPIITTNYVEELNQIVRPDDKVSDDENAAILYDKAAKLYEPFFKKEDGVTYDCNNPPPEPKGFDPGKREYSTITPEDEILLNNWLSENIEALELWIQGSQKLYFWREYGSENDEFYAILMPNLADYRKICRIMMWRAYLDAKEGSFESSFNNILSVYRSGKHLKDQQILIEQLVGMAILSLANDTANRIISDFNVDNESLEYISTELELLVDSIDLTLNFEGERYFALDEVQRSYVTTPIGDHLYLKRISVYAHMFGIDSFDSFSGAMKLLFMQPDKKESISNIQSFYEKIEGYSNEMPCQVDSVDSVFDEIENNTILSALVPAFDKVIGTSYCTKIEIQTTILILAAHLYKADNGSFPDSLDRLVCDGYIEQIPIDSFSGKPFVYRKTDDSFLLYSVGLNEIDNGGKIEYGCEGKKILWSKKGGYDAVFWPVD